MTRHESREKAFCLIFEYSFGGNPEEIINNAKEYREESFSAFSVSLFNGTVEHIDEIDAIIGKNTENRAFSRIAKVPLSALRIAIYEILYTETPKEIAVNEALEICREYNFDDSVSYVNGILAKVNADKKESEE